MLIRRAWLPALLLLLALPALPQDPAAKVGSAEAITVPRLRAHLEFIAHDLLEGRNTPSRGLDIAAEYIAAQLKLWGVKPGAEDGSYFQSFPIRGGQTTRNVVGIVEGTDPQLKLEYIALGSHYDHVGMGGNAEDKIFNGADDDGSGTVALLEIAHALATGKRPKRSVLFVWHAGEEQGLWGSRYFVNNPTVPLKSIVAQLNIDMIGRSKQPGDQNPRNALLSGPNGLFVIGPNHSSRDLGKIFEQANASLYHLKLDPMYDEPNHPERLFFRSDHYSYAQKGIPILFFFTGLHEDYHGVGDEVHKIDFTKMERISRTIYATVWMLGNRSDRPKLNG
ncbi:MAG TPA: M28 family peptidase [Fimbriimonadaceae bacterium]|nr:M28 family peptidase [Fimbriimonadaceae bacterium]